LAKNNFSGDLSAEDPTITLGVLNAVHQHEVLTQRTAAHELGIALGLVNAYLKRCARKGFIKIQQAPRNRYMYYLTPQGFAEKSRLTAEYLTQGFKFFGLARQEISQILDQCGREGLCKIAVYKLSDLAEIAVLCAQEADATLIIIDPDSVRDMYLGIRVVKSIAEAGDIDAILVTDSANPQKAYEDLCFVFPENRILTPTLLNVSRGGRNERR
jgi:DNA-binding MarR family transcriptional regulator